MSDDEKVPPGGYRPTPKSAVLTYTVNAYRGDYLDATYLGELAEQWGALVATGLPGANIEKIEFDGKTLMVEFR